MKFGTNIFWVKFEKDAKMQTQKDKIAKATKFEPKIDDTSRQDKLAQSNEEAEALEYSKTLAQIPENLKKADLVA